MKGVIVLAHGSKRKETETTLDSLIQKIQNRMKNVVIIAAFLQFSQQDLAVAVQRLSEQGVTEIKVVPLFLFDGIHVTKDIPDELAKLQAIYPHIAMCLTEHLGDDDRIAEIVVNRIRQ